MKRERVRERAEQGEADATLPEIPTHVLQPLLLPLLCFCCCLAPSAVYTMQTKSRARACVSESERGRRPTDRALCKDMCAHCAHLSLCRNAAGFSCATTTSARGVVARCLVVCPPAAAEMRQRRAGRRRRRHLRTTCVFIKTFIAKI